MLKTKVKASAITNLTDARYFAAWEVEWMGFNLEKGAEEFMEPAKIHAIKEWVDGPKIVGEFGLTDAKEIQETAALLQLDTIQINFLTGLDVLMQLSDYEVIKEIVVEKSMPADEIEFLINQFAPYVDYILLDFSKNDISWEELKDAHPVSLQKLKELILEYPILLALDFSDEVLKTALSISELKGISIKGGVEEKIGYKSYDELDVIFENLKTEENE